jgi:parallel beta-helix repeat protein
MDLSTRSGSRARRLPPGTLPGLVALGLLATQLVGGQTVRATAGTFTTSDRFVAPAGSDDGPGSLDRPWRTIQHALDRAPAAIYLRAGVYRGGVTVRRSGLVLGGFPGETAVISGGGRDVVRFQGVSSGVLREVIVRDAPDVGGSGVIVGSSSNVTIEDDVVRDNRSYGIRTWNSTNVRIARNDIFANDTGVQVSYAAGGVVVADNLVHDNDRMIVNTPDVYGDDHGAVGIVFLKTSGPTLATGNQVWGNRAASYDYGQDGGAFEVYGASDVTISDNIAWDNKDVLETGTSGLPCARLRFVRNVAYAASSLPGWSRGLILACASDSLVANNTLDGFDVSAVSVVQDPGNLYLGSVDGLRLTNNILVSDGAPIYHLSNVPGTVRIDRNLVWNRAGRSIAWIDGRGSTSNWATFRAWTGFEATGRNLDPQFNLASGPDHRLRPGSPAIDRGVRLPGLTDGYLGRGPDLGRWETR